MEVVDVFLLGGHSGGVIVEAGADFSSPGGGKTEEFSELFAMQWVCDTAFFEIHPEVLPEAFVGLRLYFSKVFKVFEEPFR